LKLSKLLLGIFSGTNRTRSNFAAQNKFEVRPIGRRAAVERPKFVRASASNQRLRESAAGSEQKKLVS
jgi:hypothetical protein